MRRRRGSRMRQPHPQTLDLIAKCAHRLQVVARVEDGNYCPCAPSAHSLRLERRANRLASTSWCGREFRSSAPRAAPARRATSIARSSILPVSILSRSDLTAGLPALPGSGSAPKRQNRLGLRHAALICRHSRVAGGAVVDVAAEEEHPTTRRRCRRRRWLRAGWCRRAAAGAAKAAMAASLASTLMPPSHRHR